MILKMGLPKDTMEIINYEDIDNVNLKLNKAVRYEKNDKDPPKSRFIFFKSGEKGTLMSNSGHDSRYVNGPLYRYRSNIKKLNMSIKTARFKSDWRLIVGLGNESVHETSMALHHIYGIPYIPGSAVKGAIRNYYINEIFEDIGLKDRKQVDIIERVLEDFNIAEDRNLDHEAFKKKFAGDEILFRYFSGNNTDIINFQNIFGTPKKIGKIIFFDAYPCNGHDDGHYEFSIKLDIINVHYPNYYGGDKPPADYQNPNLIQFLTVEKTIFEFMLGTKKKDNDIIKNGKFEGKNLLEAAYENMQKTLSEHGIGAKTAVGYGYLNEVSADNKSNVSAQRKKSR